MPLTKVKHLISDAAVPGIFFDGFVANGMRLVAMTALMGEELHRISFDRITKDDRAIPLAGWASADWLKGKSGFIVPVLSGKGAHYHLILMLPLPEDPSLADFVKACKQAQVAVSAHSQSTLAGCTEGDSDEDERRLPGSSSVLFHGNRSLLASLP